MTTATERLRNLIHRDLEQTGHKMEPRGHDWHQITEAEEEVFGLSLDEVPSLVVVWTAYEAILGICDQFEIPDDLAAAFIAEHPWMEERRKSPTIDIDDFTKFGALFGYPFRSTARWYMKHEAYSIRIGVTWFADEAPPAPASAPASNDEQDDEIPF